MGYVETLFLSAPGCSSLWPMMVLRSSHLAVFSG